MSIWWEKTVEYTFILRLHETKRLLLAPLDGAHERAGDAMIGVNRKWLLIEFKRNFNAMKSEIEKFDNYPKASATLRARDQHHFMVFGISSSSGGIDLCAQTYFSGKNPESLEKLLGAGSDLAEFSDYLKSFVALKKPPKGDSSSNGRFSDFSMVAGVNGKGEMVECMSIHDFGIEKGLELKNGPERTPAKNSPSR